MTAPPPRRPWWRGKRTWAAWLVVYLASVGPIVCGAARGYLPQAVGLLCLPAIGLAVSPPGRTIGYRAYLDWWAGVAAEARNEEAVRNRFPGAYPD